MASGQPAVGHQRLLLALLVFGILNFVLVFTVFPEFFFLQSIIWITSVIVVYLNAKEVDRAKEGKRAALIFRWYGQSTISAVNYKNGIIQSLSHHLLGMRPC
jgi:hypothetical protein